jgi:hypothetical protein
LIQPVELEKVMPISLLFVEDLPLSKSGVYQKVEQGLLPAPIKIRGRNAWFKDDIDPLFDELSVTTGLILQMQQELPDGFTEYELRTSRLAGLKSKQINLWALRQLVEDGYLKRETLPTGGRSRVQYSWRLRGA